jgi:hypothetical protein
MEQEEEVIIENIEEPVLVNSENNMNPALEGQSGEPKPAEEPKPEVVIPKEEVPEIVPSIKNMNNDEIVTRLTFNDVDSVLDEENKVKNVVAPKTIDQLEKISMERTMQRKLEEESDDEDDRIKIHTDKIDLSGFDVLDMDTAGEAVSLDDPVFEFEEL